MKTFKTLFMSEMKLSLRQVDLPIFGLIFPMLVALIQGYLDPLKTSTSLGLIFASVSTIGLAANGLMGIPLTLCGYRHLKVLKQFKVTPLSSFKLLMTQVLTKFILSILSVLLVWITLNIAYHYQFQGSVFWFILYYVWCAGAIFGIGLMIASLCKDTNQANLWTSLIYFPMLFLSGSVIPLSVLPDFLQHIFKLIPLAQGINLLTQASITSHNTFIMQPVLILGFISLCAIIISSKTFRWE